MSRVAKRPVPLSSEVQVLQEGSQVKVKGKLGELHIPLHPLVSFEILDNVLTVKPKDTNSQKSWAQSGTLRALIAKAVTGVTQGFERKLELVGVGYRAQVQGQELTLTLGKSHPDVYALPAGVKVVCPSQTEIVLSGYDDQRLGQVAAEIRALRPPEVYKGKGIRYAGERVLRKDAKKK